MAAITLKPPWHLFEQQLLSLDPSLECPALEHGLPDLLRLSFMVEDLILGSSGILLFAVILNVVPRMFDLKF